MNATFRIHWPLLFVLGAVLILLPIDQGYSLQQVDTVFVPSDIPPGEGNLNEAVQAAIDANNLSNTVFMLEPNGYYVLIVEMFVPPGEHLTIVGPEPGTTQETAPPQIRVSSVFGDVSYYIINCYGDLTLKNLWILYASVEGFQEGVTIFFQDDSTDVDGRSCEFENVIIDYSQIAWNGGGSITVACTKFKGIFRNSYWKNCIDTHFRYYGRAVSFPFLSEGWQIDSLLFENCTFANIGYVYMQELGNYADVVRFNHCTFLNVSMFSLQSGWWNTLSVTNSIFANTHMHGDYFRSWISDEPYGATLRIDSLSREYTGVSPDPVAFTFPFTESDRRILFTSSSYHLQEWVRDWMWNNPWSVDLRNQGREDEVPMPQPMLSPGTLRFFDSTDSQGMKIFPYMNRANLYDSTDPGFVFPPTDTTSIKAWLERKWFDAQDWNWAWKPQNSIDRLWPLEENLAYTNETVKTAGMGGFPLGDLYRWWPEEYQEWKAQEAAENDTINKWLHYGFGTITSIIEDPGIPSRFELAQNYPNPFNPTTNFRFRIAKFGLVQLKIFDVLGREITTLVHKELTPSEHLVQWDATNYPSGVYFYRLTANGFVETKKLVLLK